MKQLTINKIRDKKVAYPFAHLVKGQLSKVSCPRTRGFTLIEMMVSLGLFTIILFIATSAFLTIVDADRKSRATRIAMDNLNLALEDISRRVKTGTSYYCGESTTGTLDCTGTTLSSSFSFNDQASVRVIYKWVSGSSSIVDGSGCGPGYSVGQGCILRSEGGVFTLATSPEIDIKNLKFTVWGSHPELSDSRHRQPVVAVFADGILGANSPRNAVRSEFKIQTTIVQRAYDY